MAPRFLLPRLTGVRFSNPYQNPETGEVGLFVHLAGNAVCLKPDPEIEGASFSLHTNPRGHLWAEYVSPNVHSDSLALTRQTLDLTGKETDVMPLLKEIEARQGMFAWQESNDPIAAVLFQLKRAVGLV